MPTLRDLWAQRPEAGAALRDLLQGMSNAAASNVSGPVDAIAGGLRIVGVPVPADAVGGSEWMARHGLTREPEIPLAGAVGEGLGNALMCIPLSELGALRRAMPKR